MTHSDDTRPPIYGLMAEFRNPEELTQAAYQARQAGYRHVDAYSPFPIEGLAEVLGMKNAGVPTIMFIGGLCGLLGAIALAYYTQVYDYPLNIGGRPYFSIVSFIPIIFECTVLLSAISGVVGMIVLNKLPMPYHPVFNVPRFELASRNAFFLTIEARDPHYDADRTRAFLEGLHPMEINDVDH